MAKNGLEYICLKTKSVEESINSEQEILNKFSGDGWFIAYLFHRVVIGEVKNKQFIYYKMEDNDLKLDEIIKLRIFNNESELFVWRSNLGGYFSRLRTDGEGDSQGVIDSSQILFGTKAETVGDVYLKLTEERGTEIIFPAGCVNIKIEEINSQKKRIAIHTRSYVGRIDETGVATYVDVRFLRFDKY